VDFQRLTDVEGLKETPAVSPDGKMVAFVAIVAGKRQIWIRLLAGGAVLQLTRDDADHTHPRWAPDSSTLMYFTPAATESDAGTVWEIGALGGWPRRIATALGAADISHDGQRIAMLQSSEDQLALVVASRDGSRESRVVFLPSGSYANVRWAPDDRSIAYQRLAHGGFDGHLEVAILATGERHEVARGTWLQGFAWLPDGSGFVYSSSRGSTMLYPPVFNLRAVRRDGSDDRQLTFGDHSYVETRRPCLRQADRGADHQPLRHLEIPNRWLAARKHDERCSDNPPDGFRFRCRRRAPMTGRLRSCRTPAGTRTCGSPEPTGPPRVRLTFETDPDAGVGVPAWSPRGDVIAFVRTELATAALWAVRPDGSGLRQMVQGWGPCWSADGRWLYYWRLGVEPAESSGYPPTAEQRSSYERKKDSRSRRSRPTARRSSSLGPYRRGSLASLEPVSSSSPVLPLPMVRSRR
jgi:Tol biopolymer transport system component